MKKWTMKYIIFFSILFTTMMVFNSQTTVININLFKLSALNMNMTVSLDWMSTTFSSIVCVISMMITKYCSFYMPDEPMKKRFTTLVNLFVLSMIILIYSPNLLNLMVGWDGLGLSSLCLVMFYQNQIALKSGLITIYSNRVGDVTLIMAIATMWKESLWSTNTKMCSITSILIVASAMTKSAQSPFSAWLPAAMAAPTPVSSLVHSSTLVTAGVYMISRFSNITKMKSMQKIIMMTSMMTSMIAGVTAWKEKDAKKVVAMSTLSQLGLMMFSLSMNMWKVTFFHMSTHAIFKALLFMTMGFGINKEKGSQDSRTMSISSQHSPSTPMAMSTANLSLMGFPFMSGFYSKDLILESTMSKTSSILPSSLSWGACVLTTIYTMVLMKSVTSFQSKSWKEMQKQEEKNISIPTTIMTMNAICMGSIISSKTLMSTSTYQKTEKMMGIMIITMGILTSTKTQKKNSFFNNSNMSFMKWLTADFLSNTNTDMKKKTTTEKIWKKNMAPWSAYYGGSVTSSHFLQKSSPQLMKILPPFLFALILMQTIQ